MSTAVLDITSVRARFSALAAAARVLRRPRRHAVPGRGDRRDRRLSQRVECERRSALRDEPTHRRARRSAPTSARGRFLGCSAGEIAFGQSMTALNFLLTRALARTLRSRRRGRRDGPRPRRERLPVARARPRPRDRRADGGADRRARGRLRRPRRPALRPHPRRRVSRWRPTRSGTAPDVRRIVDLAHDAGALAWADAVHYAPARADRRHRLGRRRPHLLAVQVLRPAHGGRVREAGAARVVARRTRCGRQRTSPSGHRFELGDASARASRRLRRGGGLRRLARLGRDSGARARARRAVPGRASGAVELYGLPTMVGRVPTFCFNIPGRSPGGGCDVPGRARHRRLARELLRGRDDEAPRPRGRRGPRGIVHYNTEDEVDRLLAGLAELA